ncbi:NAD-dependent epimerase/dehydratase family protein [Bdellovibrio sp. HCB2-146]|uniref:NAD-dependent epimerase/dehydratase family protein n=1 Tax=Bdellovibrio sp. HCB2-146 TaxID=3394362 RepID=UPI0039BCDD2D
MISQGFWKDRKVFILGHTGFRGAHLAQVLQGLGAQVSGLGLLPKTNPSFFEIENIAAQMSSTLGDVRDFDLLKSQIEFHRPEIIFSLLGGSGLKSSKEDPRETFDVQLMGTVNLLECVRASESVRAVVLLTSDKIYRRAEHSYNELDALGGSSPAATAKACIELVVESYLQSYFQPEKYNKHEKALATARMGAAIGSGDFEPESLMWQAVQALQSGAKLELRNPLAVRSWLGLDDALRGLLILGQSLLESGPRASGAWNFPASSANRASVREFLNLLGFPAEEVPEGKPSVHGEMSGDKALHELGWQAEERLDSICTKTLSWYRAKGFLK